jgi:hypothetical protein
LNFLSQSFFAASFAFSAFISFLFLKLSHNPSFFLGFSFFGIYSAPLLSLSSVSSLSSLSSLSSSFSVFVEVLVEVLDLATAGFATAGFATTGFASTGFATAGFASVSVLFTRFFLH